MDYSRAYFNSLKQEASKLGNYTKISINELADNYCAAHDANDESKMNTYIAALMLRFWYQLGRMQFKTQTAGIPAEDLVDKLYDCITIACEYRAWQKPGATSNAQACINQTIASRGVAAILYESNLKKNARPTSIISIDEELDEDSGLTIGDMIDDPSSTVSYDTTYDLVQSCINDNHVVEAIIADLIAHAEADLFNYEHRVIKTETAKYTQNSETFAPRKLVQLLCSLDDKYAEYFKSVYKISDLAYAAAANSLISAKNTKKYKMISATTEYLKARIWEMQSVA